ncbi:Adenosylmethionine-8-amino-7-oxononanoate aminotransferase-like protein [Dorcoceras hygrometricum]|uniref:Adenosylmethionine-8-amino-7-oxononanoate aminotransferase-like protein n=1 Tax=Dorcoceras hygrometricum TaxID=472368 RepID=A0A2Z7AED6_9LAMI|nr:Adenosylmethionine-8-amino-7-oxononanoate aminotransferase-like protein [Dorcoceras hygrometricum]
MFLGLTLSLWDYFGRVGGITARPGGSATPGRASASRMAPKSRSRLRKYVVEESRAQNCDDDAVQPSRPERRCATHVEAKVEQLAHQVDEMELVLARFQRMNPRLSQNHARSRSLSVQPLGTGDHSPPSLSPGPHTAAPKLHVSNSTSLTPKSLSWFDLNQLGSALVHRAGLSLTSFPAVLVSAELLLSSSWLLHRAVQHSLILLSTDDLSEMVSFPAGSTAAPKLHVSNSTSLTPKSLSWFDLNQLGSALVHRAGLSLTSFPAVLVSAELLLSSSWLLHRAVQHSLILLSSLRWFDLNQLASALVHRVGLSLTIFPTVLVSAELVLSSSWLLHRAVQCSLLLLSFATALEQLF